MSGSLGNLNIELGLNSVNFSNGLSNAEYKARQFAKHATSDLERIRQSVETLERSSRRLTTSFAQIGVAGLASRLKTISDSYTELGNRMNLISENATAAARKMQTVFDISMKTNQGLEATSTIYQRFGQNAQQLGLSQVQVASLTETVSKAVAVSGASAASAQAALMQFGQSLASGIFRGQEFNSVMEQTPALAKAIASGLGVTVGELRNMANAGQLTMDVVIPALERAKASVDKQFSTRILTISAALENLNTATIQWVGNFDNAAGISHKLANALNGLSNNFGYVANSAIIMGVAFGGLKLTQHTAETVRNTLATREQATATLQTTAATYNRISSEVKATQAYIADLQAQINLARTEKERLVLISELQIQTARETALLNEQAVAANKLSVVKKSASLLGGAISALGGVTGVATLAVSAGVAAYYSWAQSVEEARQKALDFANELPEVITQLEKMNSIELGANKAKAEESIDAQKKHIADLKREIKELSDEIKKTPKFYTETDDNGYEIQIDNTQKLINLNRELAIKNEELQKSQKGLNSSLEDLDKINAQQPIAELRDRLQELFPELDASRINVEQLGFSLQSLNKIFPQAGEGADVLGVKVLQLGSQALIASQYFRNLQQSIQSAIDPKVMRSIGIKELQVQALKAKSKGDMSLFYKNQAKANVMSSLGKGFDENDPNVQHEIDLESQRIQLQDQISHHGSKVKKEKGSKIDYDKKLTDQTTELEKKLAELKANSRDIQLYGEISQYQELTKLTADIAANGEKYAHYGVQGIENLKRLASQVDSEQQKSAINQFQFDNSKKLQAMEFELTLIGKTRQEQEQLQFNHNLELEALRLKNGMTKENIALLDQKIAKLKEEYAELQKKREEQKFDPVAGIKAAWGKIEDDATNVYENIQGVATNAFNGMADTLTDFLMTGKADFRGFAQSVLKDIGAMIVKMALFNAIKAGMEAMGYSDGGYVGATNFATGGYTGDGGKYSPAGIVHRGEYVITKEATSRLGRGFLDHLNYGTSRGFANGGGVAVPTVPAISWTPQRNNNIVVNVINQGEPMQANVNQKQNGNNIEITVELFKQMDKIADARYRHNQQNDFRSGGVFSR